MPGTTPFIGYGMQLSFLGVDSAEHQLAGLQSAQVGSNKVDTIETTDTNATAGFKSFIPGMEDAGDFSVTANYLPGDTTQKALVALKEAHVSTTFAFVLPSAVTGSRTFTGIVQSVDVSLPLDKEAKLTVKIKITGQPSYS
jgi:predicted secreted protein